MSNFVMLKIKEIIEEHLGIDPDSAQGDFSYPALGAVSAAKIVEDLGADSLDVVELIMKIEDEFNIEIPDEDAENLTTVGLVVDYVMSHTS